MKKLNLHEFEVKLTALGTATFTIPDLIVMFGVESRAAQAFTSYNIKKGAFVRLKAGLFAIRNKFPSDFAVANRLYFPSYISLESALSYYNLIPETVYAVTSVTSKATREFEVVNRLFDYRKIKKEAFTGYIPKLINGEMVYIATPEKAVADYLYFIKLGKKSVNDRLDISKLDQNILKEYIDLYD